MLLAVVAPGRGPCDVIWGPPPPPALDYQGDSTHLLFLKRGRCRLGSLRLDGWMADGKWGEAGAESGPAEAGREVGQGGRNEVLGIHAFMRSCVHAFMR